MASSPSKLQLLIDSESVAVTHRPHEGGESVMLLHDLGGSSLTFQCILESEGLSSFELFIPDFLGFGDSTKPLDSDYSVSALADSLVGILPAARDPICWHIVGIGLGFLVGLELLKRNAKSIRSVVALGLGSLREGGHNDLFPVSVSESDFSLRELPIWISSRSARKLGTIDLRNSASYAYFRAAKGVEAAVRERWVEMTLNSVSRPVSIIHGNADKATVATWCEQSNSGVAVRLMPTIDRSPLEESPAYTMVALEALLSKNTVFGFAAGSDS